MLSRALWARTAAIAGAAAVSAVLVFEMPAIVVLAAAAGLAGFWCRWLEQHPAH